MKARYILRLDDACPTMKWSIWLKLEKTLGAYNIKPIIGVIPDCKDPKLNYEKPSQDFWEWVKHVQNKGWHIAMHGYQHYYETTDSGLIGLNNYSEFAGLPYKKQAEKINKGYEIFLTHGIKPKIWMAPAHSFDLNTLKALKEHTEIEYVTDGFAIFPFTAYGFKWIPQQLWRFRKMPFGVWTICLHPNTMDEKDLKSLESTLDTHSNFFINNIYELVFENNKFHYVLNQIFQRIHLFLLHFKRRKHEYKKTVKS